MRESEITPNNKYNQDIILLGGKQEVWGHWTVNYNGTQSFITTYFENFGYFLKIFLLKHSSINFITH